MPRKSLREARQIAPNMNNYIIMKAWDFRDGSYDQNIFRFPPAGHSLRQRRQDDTATPLLYAQTTR